MIYCLQQVYNKLALNKPGAPFTINLSFGPEYMHILLTSAVIVVLVSNVISQNTSPATVNVTPTHPVAYGDGIFDICHDCRFSSSLSGGGESPCVDTGELIWHLGSVVSPNWGVHPAGGQFGYNHVYPVMYN